MAGRRGGGARTAATGAGNWLRFPRWEASQHPRVEEEVEELEAELVAAKACLGVAGIDGERDDVRRPEAEMTGTGASFLGAPGSILRAEDGKGTRR